MSKLRHTKHIIRNTLLLLSAAEYHSGAWGARLGPLHSCLDSWLLPFHVPLLAHARVIHVTLNIRTNSLEQDSMRAVNTYAYLGIIQCEHVKEVLGHYIKARIEGGGCRATTPSRHNLRPKIP
jgi:hypothetical protein